MSQVGTIDLLDLKLISEYHGHNFLPYPTMLTQRSRFCSKDEASAYAITVPDRYRHGDLRPFMECVVAYGDADIRVECHVQYIPATTPSVRVMAWRTGSLGFFAAQRTDEDVVDVHSVSPYDLGAAIAEAVPLEQPGGHSAIVVPEYVPRSRGEFDTADFSVSARLAAPTEVTIHKRDVTVFGTVQSHWRPARKWGFDRGKAALVWIRVNGDGDYIYAQDSSHARPMTTLMLQDRTDRLIADDILILKEFRRD
jgi:hypothetical protein